MRYINIYKMNYAYYLYINIKYTYYILGSVNINAHTVNRSLLFVSVEFCQGCFKALFCFKF